MPLAETYNQEKRNNLNINRKQQSVIVSSYNRASQWLPYPSDEIFRKRGNYDVYTEMSRDQMVKACIETKQNLITGSTYEIRCDNDEIREFVSDNLENYLEGNFMDNVYGILSSMIYGFSVTEKIYEYNSGKIWLKKLVTAPPDSIEFNMTKFGDIISVNQFMDKGVQAIGIDKFIHHAWNFSNADPYGVSDLRSAYIPWFSKKEIVKYLNMFLERYGMPYIVATYDPANEGGKEDLQKVVESMMAATGAVIPEGVVVEIKEVKQEAANSFIDSIIEYNKQISTALLIPDLLGFNDTHGGSYSLGEQQIGIFQLNLDRYRNNLEKVINKQLLKQLVDINFPSVDQYPRIKFIPLERDLTIARIEKFITACEKAIIVPQPEQKRHLAELLKFPFDATLNEQEEAKQEEIAEQIGQEKKEEEQLQENTDIDVEKYSERICRAVGKIEDLRKKNFPESHLITQVSKVYRAMFSDNGINETDDHIKKIAITTWKNIEDDLSIDTLKKEIKDQIEVNNGSNN